MQPGLCFDFFTWAFVLFIHSHICRPRGVSREVGETLPFGGHRHGSSWINELFRAGLSESLSIMSPWVVQTRRQAAQDTGDEGGPSKEVWNMDLEGEYYDRDREKYPELQRDHCLLPSISMSRSVSNIGNGMIYESSRRCQRHYSYFESLRYAFNDAYWELCDFRRP